jgi:phosphoribosylformylglycinamidine cyclo-ligase
VVKEILRHHRSNIHGMIHCTGGAQTKILNFVENMHVVKNQLFETPEVFRIIQQESQTPWKEMYQVFNMGHRFELYLPEEHAGEVIDISRSFGLDSQKIGYCHESGTKKLTIEGPHGTFEYH